MGSRAREAYFTPANLAGTAAGMLVDLEGSVRIRRRDLAPERSALLALDLQRYFLDAASHAFVPSGPAILTGVNALVRAYAARGLPVILTRHVNTPEDAGLMGTWWRDLIKADDPLSGIDPRLERGGGIEVRKMRYDAFFGTSLELLLHEQGVSQVVVCGVMTHLCVETTARSAFMRGFEVFLPIDGTATYTEAFHRASLLTLAHGFATPLLVADVLHALEEHA
jgi:nicotinamidase-related amidase